MTTRPILKAALPLAGALIAGCGQGTVQPEINELRAPAYPLVTIDPYTSAWSMYDNLYDGSIRHWTGKDFPLIGAIEVDGQTYRFMGTEDVEMLPIVPTSQQGGWEGRYVTSRPAGSWQSPDYDDSGWASGIGAFGTTVNEPTARTDWSELNIFVRREFDLKEDIGGRPLYLEFCNDDDAIFYINGVEIHNTGSVCHKNEIVRIPDEAAAALKPGRNVIAAECTNPVANGLLDFGILMQKDLHTALEQTAVQTSVNVQATQTYYTFDCGPVSLALTFTAPLLMDDIYLLSRPVNYISYKVESKDGKAHNVRLYFEASPRWALDQPYQASVSETFTDGDLVFFRSGSKEQDILAKKGDDIRIDWGYFYLAADKAGTQAAVGEAETLRQAFASGDSLPECSTGENSDGRMAFIQNLVTVAMK